MLKSCSRCGKLHKYGYTCKEGNRPDYKRYTNYAEAELRNTYEWHAKAQQIKADSNYLCAICFEKGIYNYNNLEVHHITKLKEDSTGLLDNYNLICLCKDCHTLADAGIIKKEHLLELARQREEKTS